MNPQVENIMRLANLHAMRRCRQAACLQPTYRGSETAEGTAKGVLEAKNALQAAVEAYGAEMEQVGRLS